MTRSREKISWVLSDSVLLDPTQDIDDLKKIGAFWGSWRTWRACQTDNVICHDQVKADELIKRQFQNLCNFYVPDSVYADLDRPANVKVYAGEFVHDVICQEEIVAMHLSASTSDIVLMLGWNLAELQHGTDRLLANQEQHHRNLVRQAFISYTDVQWVIVDHPETLALNLTNLNNLACDTLETVLTLI
jgi:hypothetical protein